MSVQLHHHFLGSSHRNLPSELQYSRLLMFLPSFHLFSTKQLKWSHNSIHLLKALQNTTKSSHDVAISSYTILLCLPVWPQPLSFLRLQTLWLSIPEVPMFPPGSERGTLLFSLPGIFFLNLLTLSGYSVFTNQLKHHFVKIIFYCTSV